MEDSDAVRDNTAARHFELAIGDAIAVADYELADGVMTFTHTFVPESLRGRGLATRLVKAGLDAARARGLKVVPRCATFVAYVKAHPETQDLLTAEARISLGS